VPYGIKMPRVKAKGSAQIIDMPHQQIGAPFSQIHNEKMCLPLHRHVGNASVHPLVVTEKMGSYKNIGVRPEWHLLKA